MKFTKTKRKWKLWSLNEKIWGTVKGVYKNGKIFVEGAANEEENVIIISLWKQLKQWKTRSNTGDSDLHDENNPKEKRMRV